MDEDLAREDDQARRLPAGVAATQRLQPPCVFVLSSPPQPHSTLYVRCERLTLNPHALHDSVHVAQGDGRRDASGRDGHPRGHDRRDEPARDPPRPAALRPAGHVRPVEVGDRGGRGRRAQDVREHVGRLHPVGQREVLVVRRRALQGVGAHMLT